MARHHKPRVLPQRCTERDEKHGEEEEGATYPLREVHFDAEDTNILWARTLGLGIKDRGRGERGSGSFNSHCMREEGSDNDCGAS
jgi:hypothetical protein